MLEGRRKAIEEKRRLLEAQAGPHDPLLHDAREAGAKCRQPTWNGMKQPHRQPAVDALAFCLPQEMARLPSTLTIEVKVECEMLYLRQLDFFFFKKTYLLTHHQEEHWNRMGAKPKRRMAMVEPVQAERRRGEGLIA